MALPMMVGVAGAALVALLAFGLFRQGASAQVEGRAAPVDSLPVLGRSEQRRSLTHWRGKVVVLNLFASWCGPCREETPLLQSEQRRLARRGATVVGVTYNDTEPDALAFVRRYAVTFPVLRDVDEKLARRLGVNGIPETFVIDRRGRVVATRRAPVDRAFLRRAIGMAQ